MSDEIPTVRMTTVYSDRVEAIRHPHPSEFNLTTMRQLDADRTLVDIHEIGDMLQISMITVWNFRRGMENYLRRALTTYPPPPTAQLRTVWPDPDDDSDPGAVEVPPNPAILPPPAIGAEAGPGQMRWYKGDIYWWGRVTRRLDEDGRPIPASEQYARRNMPTMFRRMLPKRLAPDS